MRYVNRSSVSRPKVLEDRGTKAAEEREKVEEFYRSTKDGSYSFSVYAEPEVKHALERLFRGKCAYCETRYTALHPVDVEHYRPKSRVDDAVGEDGEHRGYYWLASEWENLLPSCIDCNRKRWHVLVSGEKRSYGKADRFPIAEGDRHARTREEFKKNPERALLLHPCEDRPEEHLEFRADGFVFPRATPCEQELPKGAKSIEVLGLNRPGLVFERYEMILLLERSFFLLEALAKLLSEAKLTRRHQFAIEDLIDRELQHLKRFARPEAPFSAFARAHIERFLRQWTGDPSLSFEAAPSTETKR